MKIVIWPGRSLGIASSVPALLSLALFVNDDFLPLVAGDRHRGGRTCRLRPAHALGGRPHFGRAATGAVCSLNEPGEVELVLENQRPHAAVPAVRDDVPDEFTAEPASFEVKLPGKRKAMLTYQVRSQAARNLPLRASRCARLEPAGILAPAVVVAALHRGPGLPRHSPGRALFDAGPARPAEHDRRCADRGGWGRTTNSSGCATTSRATIRGTSTGVRRHDGEN